MKKIAALLLLMLMPRLLGAVPSRLTDGNVEFAIATVGETAVFNLEEKTRLFAKNPTAPVVDLTPKSWEVNLSTCLVVVISGEKLVGFDNYSDYLACQTLVGLKKKIRKIRQVIDSMSDLSPSETLDLKNRLGWLNAYYQSLP